MSFASWRADDAALSSEAVTGLDPCAFDKLSAGQALLVFELNFVKAKGASSRRHPETIGIGAHHFARASVGICENHASAMNLEQLADNVSETAGPWIEAPDRKSTRL